MVDEGDAARSQLADDLRDVALEHVFLDMDKRIKGEDEIEGAVGCRVQVVAVVVDKARVGGAAEAGTAGVGALLGKVDAEVGIAGAQQELGPAAKPRGDLEDGFCRQHAVQAGVEGAEPVGFAAAPRLAP